MKILLIGGVLLVGIFLVVAGLLLWTAAARDREHDD